MICNNADKKFTVLEKKFSLRNLLELLDKEGWALPTIDEIMYLHDEGRLVDTNFWYSESKLRYNSYHASAFNTIDKEVYDRNINFLTKVVVRKIPRVCDNCIFLNINKSICTYMMPVIIPDQIDDEPFNAYRYIGDSKKESCNNFKEDKKDDR